MCAVTCPQSGSFSALTIAHLTRATMDNAFANQTLTPDLLANYFDTMETAVEQLEKSVPKSPPGKDNPFAERRLISLWSTEKPGSPVTETRVRPDWRALASRADVVPYKLEA